jgi:hypothetical protein
VARLATALDNYFGDNKRFCFLCGGFGYALPEGGGSAKTAETTTQNTRAFLFGGHMRFDGTFKFITAENVHKAIIALDYMANIWRIEGTEGRITDDSDWQILRRITFDNQGRFCCNCERSDTRLDVHHIVPIEHGGTNRLSNLAVLCFDCHAKIHPWMRNN